MHSIGQQGILEKDNFTGKFGGLLWTTMIY